jgi:hypothetical protein
VYLLPTQALRFETSHVAVVVGLHILYWLQKLRGTRRKKEAETRVDTFQRLTDDEKGDIVSQAIEALQSEIEQVRLVCKG